MGLSNYGYSLNDYSSNTPWNDEYYVPEKDFEVTCSQTLSRTAKVTTDNYIPGAEGCDYEPDGEGGYNAFGWHDDDDTSDTNWADEYKENGHYTPLQLIQMLKEYVLKDAERYLEEHKDDGPQNGKQPVEYHWEYKRLLKLAKECDGWSDDETEIMEA